MKRAFIFNRRQLLSNSLSATSLRTVSTQPWVRDLRDAASDCDTATTRRECEADGAARSFTVDADRISRLKYALIDPNWNPAHLPDGGDGAALAMRSRSWLMLVATSAAAVLLGSR